MAEILPAQPPLVKIYGRTGSAQCYAVRDFLYRNDVPFEWVELRTDEEARAIGARQRHRRSPAGLRLRRRDTNRAADDSADQREARLVPRSVAVRIRPGDLRRRSGRTERSRLRRVGRSEDGRHRALGGRRAGGQQPEDRELSWFSAGHQRRRARRPRPRAGVPVRRRDPDRPRRSARRVLRGQARRLPCRRHEGRRARGNLRDRHRLSPPGRAERREVSRRRRLLRSRRERSSAVRRAARRGRRRRQFGGAGNAALLAPCSRT